MKKLALAVCTLLVFIFPVHSMAGVVLDFESVADGGVPCFGGTCAIVGNPYVEDGFVVNSANTEFASWDSTNVNNPGSKTLNAGNDGETIGLFVEPVPGPVRFFTLHSIDLSELFSTGGTVPVTFTGFKMDSSTVTATFNLDGVFGFETFTFTGWDNLLGVTWVQTADYHQFDNIVVSVLVDTYLGMNVQNNTAGPIEVQLLDITYIGGSSIPTTVSMPAFSAFNCTSEGFSAPCVGMPDIGDFPTTASSTYTNGGDGETTRTIGQTVSIDWDTSGPVPTINIVGVTVIAVGATWTAEPPAGYMLGLIPSDSGDTELVSFLASPQGDIYDSLAGGAGNSAVPFIATTVSDPAFEGLLGSAFGEFIFAAATVPSTCNFAANPASLSFGSVTAGNTSTLQTTVTNNGTAACNIIAGVTGAEFSASPLTVTVAANGGTTSVSVDYTPVNGGADTGNLNLSSDDVNNPQSIDVPLSGIGIPLVDSDNDGIPDISDNCTLLANADQRDTDLDGYGNRCDADIAIPNNGTVNLSDYSAFRSAFGGTAPLTTAQENADFNGDGFVNLSDYSIFRSFFGKVPGPSCCGL